MARETRYFVQAFKESRVARTAAAPTRCKDNAAARQAVIRLRESAAVAVAFSSSGDGEHGDFDEEEIVLTVVGVVPENFHQ